MLIIQAILVFSFIRGIYSQVDVAECNHKTSYCECKNPNAETCEFTLDIEMLQTFTRYLLDKDEDSRGTAGSVWRINNGKWGPVDPTDTLCDSSMDDDQCTQPFGVDGYTFRSFIAVNGRIPGPTLIVTKDQLVRVTVINRLASESVSIHWHGMHQKKSNWMDGVEHVTQCGIPPGASFTYIFKADPSGTHWYHSHSGAQRTDGLFGALIVKERGNTHKDKLITELGRISALDFKITNYEDKPEQHTLTLLDWQKSSSLDLFTQIHSNIRYFNIDKASELSGSGADRTYSSDDAEIGPVPYWSGLINGRGRHFEVNYRNSMLSNFRVNYGQTYRFRLIGAQSLYAYRFSIEEHKLIVIATDGQFINPSSVNTDSESTIKNTVVDYIIIHSGERYDFLLQTKSKSEVGTKIGFMMQAVILNFTQDSLEKSYTSYGGSAEAILHYGSDDPPSPRQYTNIANNIKKVITDTQTGKCTPTEKCIALNCPFQNFPQSFNIDCIHINNLELLIGIPDNDLPDVATDDKSRLFFNFGFEGTRQTSSINGRNLKLPSASLAQLEPDKLSDIEKKEYCIDPINNKDDTKCDRDNTQEVISPDCYCTHVVDAEADRSYELVISAIGPKPKPLDNFLFAHPVHLHGHYFHVVDIQFGGYINGELTGGNSDLKCGGKTLCVRPRWDSGKDYSTRKKVTSKIPSTAPLKDTVLIPAGGYAVVYFKTDNPGWWFLHCHIEVHQLEGMGVILNEGSREEKTRPPDHMPKCGNFSFTVEQYKDAIDRLSSGSGSGSDSGDSTSENQTSEDCPFIYCGIFILFLLLFVASAVIAIVFIVFCCCLVSKRGRGRCWNKCFSCSRCNGRCKEWCNSYQVEAPEDKTPKNEAPEDKTPENEAPENKTPENEAPENKTPENEAPENKTPENEAPENKTPENEATENKTPENEATENKTPENEAT